MEKRIGQGTIVAECRSDGSSVASELFANYPCRLHLTSRPNNVITHTFNGNDSDNGDDDENRGSRCFSRALTCYVLGYGGGLISGDSIILDITVKPKASLVITSQSTSKAFKAIPGRDATFVKTTATVGKGGLLFLVPQPMQCFGGSKLEQETNVTLDGAGKGDTSLDDASLLLVDWYTGGRKNLDGGLWNMESFHTTTTISFSRSNLFSSQEVEDGGGYNGDFSSNNDAEMSPDCHERDLVFRDATRLTGGSNLVRHMRHFNIVCTVVLVGPRVKKVSDLFLKKFSSRHVFDENQFDGKLTHQKGRGLNQNRGEGLNEDNEGILVSCGTFNTLPGSNQQDSGIVVRLAADSLEIAATFLSKHIGTLDGQLEDDPFLEIFSSRHSISSQQVMNVQNENNVYSTGESNSVPIGLMKNSFTPKTVPSEGVQQTSSGIGKISPLTLYQLIDSCVPSGGFAHSNTLEVAHQLNLLKCIHSSWTESLREHCFDVLLQTFTTTVPFLLEACNLFRTHYHKGQVSKTSEELQPPTKEILRRWETLDVELRATISSHVASRASTTQGSGLLRAFSASFSDIAPVIKALRRQIIIMSPSQTSDCCGHAATCFGAVCGLLDVNNETCVSMFLYTTARDMVNAAVRMNLVGPLEGGFVTNELCTGIDELIQTHLIDLVDCEDTNQLVNTNIAHQVAPLIEVLSNAHDRLYTRLFNS